MTAAGPAAAPGGAPPLSIRLVALDLDGVVWRGEEVLPGAREALQDALRRGLDLRYVSNNSTAHRATVSDRLAGLGLPAGTERVLTSGFVTGRWLRERLPEGTPVLVVGEEGLERELREAGLVPRRAGAGAGAVVPEAAAPKAVVVGMDRQFDYAGLAEAQAAILSGALFVATNRDATFPTPHGLKPGAGAIVAAVATAAEQEPVLLGKPGLALAEVLAAVTGVQPAETLFVGDRLSTDIAMGRAAGMVTVLVLTGVTSPEDLEAARAAGSDELLPDYVLAGLADLPGLLDRLFSS
jgi:glycerol 3-phosphatase-2